MRIKKATFADSWYPAEPNQCKHRIERFLTDNNGPVEGHFAGGIVPHAGWFFSGSIACRVIASIASAYLSPSDRKVDAIFLFGMHMHPGATPRIMASGAWDTPFGPLSVHEPLASEFSSSFDTEIRVDSPGSFPEENTIEVQLPFIKYFFPDSTIVPVGVPPSTVAHEIGKHAVVSASKLDLNIIVLGSTDMTHYGSNYGFTPSGSGIKALGWVKNDNDPMAINAMCSMNASKIIQQGLTNRNLCCSGAVAAAATAAKELGAEKGIAYDYTTSYDKNPGSSFVGYSGILFSY